MKTNKQSKTNSSSVAGGVAIGVILSAILSMILVMVFSALILGERFDVSALKYIAPAILLITSFAGCLLAGKKAAGKYGIICISVAVVLVFIMIASNVIFFDGVFTGFIPKIGMVLLGCGLSSTILLKPAGKGKRKRYHR